MAKQFDTDRIFSYHPPFGNQQERYTAIRNKAKELADLMLMFAPPSRELSTALTNVQQAVMWVNAAIAINEVQPVVTDAPIVGDPALGTERPISECEGVVVSV